MKNNELATIVRKAQKNKEKYFEELFLATWDTVYYLSLKMMSDPQDAEDVAQEVFIRIHNGIDQLEKPEAFNAWMNKIVSNACNTALSNRLRIAKNINYTIDELSGFMEEDNTEFLPVEFVDSKENRDMINRLIQELPAKQKEVLLMYYYQELSLLEICEILECKLSAVKVRLFSARETLRPKIQSLQKEYGVKLYSVSGIPVFTTILKLCASDVCTESVHAGLWNKVLSDVSVSMGSMSLESKRAKTVKPRPTFRNVLTSIVGPSVPIQIMAVIAAVSSIVCGTVSGVYIVNQKLQDANTETVEQPNKEEETNNDQLEVVLPTITDKAPLILRQILGEDDGRLLYRCIKEAQITSTAKLNIVMNEILQKHNFIMEFETVTESDDKYILYSLHKRNAILYIGIRISSDSEYGLYVYQDILVTDKKVMNDNISIWFNERLNDQ